MLKEILMKKEILLNFNSDFKSQKKLNLINKHDYSKGFIYTIGKLKIE